MSVSAPLYLFERFFVGLATEHLLGEGISPAHLNDDRLGRVLDKLYYEAGLTQVFVTVAMAAARKFGVKLEFLHLDSSSFHVHGEYASNKSEAAEESTAIEITYGYSRDHRLLLKQFIVDLMCSGDGDIPLYIRVANGNEADQAMFARILKQFRQQWEIDALFVAFFSSLLRGEHQTHRFFTLAITSTCDINCCPDVIGEHERGSFCGKCYDGVPDCRVL